MAKMNPLWIVGIIVVVLLYMGSKGQTTQTTTSGGVIQQPQQVNTGCAISPAYTYSAADIFSANTMTVTTYIKSNGNKPVTTLAAPAYGEDIVYWASNATTFCPLTTTKSDCGPHSLQSQCYENGTVTLKVYDQDNARFLTLPTAASSTNATLGANSILNTQFRYQGTAKKASYPFGGCLVVEYSSNITTLTATGSGISSNSACPYIITYKVNNVDNTFKSLAIPKDFDSDATGVIKNVDMQFQSGSSNPASITYITMYAANYYVGNDGNFYLGVEKDKNQDTTKVVGAGDGTQFKIE